jgi:hypothetical protein
MNIERTNIETNKEEKYPEECPSDTYPVDNSYRLTNKWVVYDHIKSDSNTYDTSTRRVIDFDSIVGFWQTFNNYPMPSALFYNQLSRPYLVQNGIKKEITSVSVFKDKILPKWEDPINKHGAEFSKKKFNKKNPLKEIDENWINLLIACIGGMVDPSVTGVRVVDSSAFRMDIKYKENELKLLYRIEIWFSDLSRKDIVEKQFREILSIDDPKGVFFKEHS